MMAVIKFLSKTERNKSFRNKMVSSIWFKGLSRRVKDVALSKPPYLGYQLVGAKNDGEGYEIADYVEDGGGDVSITLKRHICDIKHEFIGYKPEDIEEYKIV